LSLTAFITLNIWALPAAGAGDGSSQHVAPGLARRGKPIAPRTVKPRKLPAGHAFGRSAQVRGQVPPGLGGGTATRPPEIASDVPAQKGGKLLASEAAVAAPSGSFASLLAFTGATRANSTCAQCGGEPPDSQTAIGTNEVVQAVNTHVFVYNRSGTQLGAFSALNLFGVDVNGNANTNVGLADPKILFDPSSGHYYLMMMVCDAAWCGGNGYTSMGLSLAVTSDPLGPWWVYDYINNGPNLQDQEKLGFSGDKITFAVNEYNCKCGSGSQYKQENVVVIQKSEADAGQTIHWVVFSDSSNNSDSTYLFDSMPTTPVNTSTNTQHVVWNWQGSSDNFMRLIRITGTPNGNNVDFTGNTTTLDIADQTAPPTPVQPGGTIAGDKQNFQSAVVQGNDLWAVATDGCTPQYPSPDTTTRDCTRLVEVDLASNSISTDIDIGTNGTYRYNPSVSKDSDGHLFFGFTISSSSSYPTAAIDGSAIPLPPVLQRIDFATGDAAYTGGRWGDYSSTQQDPADPHDVWSAQEFGACNTGCSNAGGGNWAVAGGQFTFRDPHITSISPTHGPATGGTSVNIYGSEFANGGTSVSFGGTPAASVTWFDSTHIRAVSPAHDSGVVDVTATTAAGTSDTSASDRFTYNPVLFSVSPANGPAEGGQSVTILGAGLNGATNVSFGGTAAASFTLINSGRIDAVTPAHARGTVQLTVTTSGGGTSNGIAYTFQFPTTTTVSSSANPSIVGASVTYTATVSPVPNGGTISFSDNGNPIAGCQLLPVNTLTGTATCTVSYTSVGNHSIVATYSGNFFYEPSTSPTLVQWVTYAIVVLYDQTRAITSGATIPIKIQLADAFGTNLSSPAIVVTVEGLSPSPAPGVPPSGTFTFLELPGHGPGYQLNVKTKDYPAATYTLSFTATGDPVTHSVQFIVR